MLRGSYLFWIEKVNVLQSKEVPLVKVHWQHRRGFGWTWEVEGEMREQYLELFVAADFEDKV